MGIEFCGKRDKYIHQLELENINLKRQVRDMALDLSKLQAEVASDAPILATAAANAAALAAANAQVAQLQADETAAQATIDSLTAQLAAARGGTPAT